MQTRWIEGEELAKLGETFAKHNWPMPAPGTARALVMEEGGEIVAFLVLQAFPHAEPMWIREDHRGSDIIPNVLADEVAHFLRERGLAWEVTADSPHVKKLCERHDMELVPSPVYRGE